MDLCIYFHVKVTYVLAHTLDVNSSSGLKNKTLSEMNMQCIYERRGGHYPSWIKIQEGLYNNSLGYSCFFKLVAGLSLTMSVFISKCLLQS